MVYSVGTSAYILLSACMGYAISKTFTPVSRSQGDRTSYVHITLSLSLYMLQPVLFGSTLFNVHARATARV